MGDRFGLGSGIGTGRTGWAGKREARQNRNPNDKFQINLENNTIGKNYCYFQSLSTINPILFFGFSVGVNNFLNTSKIPLISES